MKRIRKHPFYEYFAYGAGSFFINLSMIGERFGMYYLTNVVALPISTVGWILMFTTFFDAVNDPLIGNLADRNKSRLGRYRPFIIAGAFLLCLSMVLRFSDPPFGQTGKILYYLIVLSAGSIGVTCCAVPWQAMGVLLSGDYHKRNLFLMVRSIAMTLVTSLIGAVALKAVALLGGDDTGWRNLVLLAWIPGFAALYFCQDGMKRVDRLSMEERKEHPVKRSFPQRLSELGKNKAALFLCAAIFFYNVMRAMWNNSDLYYFQYILNDTSAFSRAEALGLPVTLACMLTAPALLKRLDKRYLLSFGLFLNTIKPLMILLSNGRLSSSAVVLLHLISSDMGATFASMLLFSLVPECVDWHHWRFGPGAAGFISASVTFMQKAGRALGQWLLGQILEQAGFQSSFLGADARSAIIQINGPVQVLGFSLLIVLALAFPISKKKGEELREKLNSRI